MPAEALLEVRNLSISLPDRRLLSESSFDIPSGCIAGLSGDSGCGKTTLGLAILRLLPSQFRVAGFIGLRGRNLMEVSERRMESFRGAEIAMVFQDPLLALNPVLRIRQQAAEALRAHRTPGNPDKLLEMAGLPPKRNILDAYPHQLSGGERQRVCLALALASRPGLIIADEPFSALDGPRVLELARLFSSLKQSLGTSFLLISHKRKLLAKISDRILVMQGGRIDAG